MKVKVFVDALGCEVKGSIDVESWKVTLDGVDGQFEVMNGKSVMEVDDDRMPFYEVGVVVSVLLGGGYTRLV